ncbi:hypothetical protein [Nonomuraea sp. NPDC046570]|uniref:hypothetical protein n=1 Tax=Nonomuraea sp. NPDC046570 TaxID=3155255 RepID=UPI0034105F78
MASEENGDTVGHDLAESLIDDLIRDILSEAGQATKARTRGGDSMATLIEAALTTVPSTAAKSSTVERLLLAQLFASALADALAPALADALAPEIMKALEHHASSGQAGAPAATPARGGRKKT